MNDRIVCPVCGQDWVRQAGITGTEVHFWVCRECESVWLSQEWISENTSEYLKDFLLSHGALASFAAVSFLDAE